MRRLWGLIRGTRRRPRSTDEDIELTAQFFVTLRANFAALHDRGHAASPEARGRLKELLDPSALPSWSDAYEVEQLLVAVYDDETLKTELAIRLVEARSALPPPLADFYAKRAEAAKTAEERRALLARVVNDLQWRYTVNEAKRRYGRRITRATAFVLVAALGLFFLLVASTVWFDLKFRYGDLRLLGLAGLAGAWGASFSMLATLRSRLDASDLNDLKAMRGSVMLTSRALVGAGAGCILYFFLLSGLLAGTAFPDLAGKAPGADVSPRDLALLVVWCFIAGFSEQLVPGILTKTEARAGTPATERFRPVSNGASGRDGNEPPAGAGRRPARGVEANAAGRAARAADPPKPRS